MGVFQPCYTPAISFTTVPAIIRPATDGTKAMLPVVRCFPGSIVSLPSSGNMAGSLEYTTFTPVSYTHLMAPAAVDTLTAHLSDTGRGVMDYDLIVTGDLGRFGSEMFRELCKMCIRDRL